MSRKEPKTLRVACFEDGRRKIITFKRGAYWWSQSEGAYPFWTRAAGSKPSPTRITDPRGCSG